MSRFARYVLSLLACVFLLVSCSYGQQQLALPNQMSPATSTGDLPYSTHEIAREDVSLSTGGLHVYIPILSLKGKGGQTFNLGWAYDTHGINLQEYDEPNGWNTPDLGTLNPFNHARWIVSPDIGGYLTVPNLRASWLFEGDFADTTCGSGNNSLCENYALFCNANFVFRDEYGTSHSFYVSRDCSNTGGNPAQRTHTMPVKDSDDGSAMRLDASNPNDIIVRTKDGTAYHFPAVTTFPPQDATSGPEQLQYYNQNFTSIVDPNGNTITNNGGSITDSVGHTITLSNGVTWQDSNGQTQSVAIQAAAGPDPAIPTDATNCSFNNSEQSSFQKVPILDMGDLSNVGDYSHSTTVSFPGGAVYTMQFDRLDELTQITYPSGGYTSYDYQTWYPQFNLGSVSCYADYREVSAKHVCSNSGGTCSQNQQATTTYSPVEVPMEGGNVEVDVRDPLGNRTHYFFSGSSLTGGTIAKVPLEYERDIYQGESTLLKKVVTDWNGYGNGALPTQVTTTLEDVNPPLVSKTMTQYDNVPQDSGPFQWTGPLPQGPIDNPTEVDEYDYDGSVKRKTAYTWEKGGNYDTSAGHILDLMQSKTVTDPATGNQSTTNNNYDTLGNLLSTTVGGTNTASATTQYQHDSYGDVIMVTDPKLNQTQYGYANPWIDSDCTVATDSGGKPSSMTNALNQTTTYKYYSCTGLLASATDPNGSTIKYSYDALGRPTETLNPDGGQTTTAYNDTAPMTVTTTKLIDNRVTPNIIKTTVSFLDGIGNPIQTQLTTDPDGEDYTDLTYDGLERVVTKSNPHRSSSLPTDGITTTVYDALGRVCATVPPDGGTPPTSCPASAVPGEAVTVYQGNCSTVTDEAGKSRKSCSDALGRLTNVWEDPAGLDYETDYTYNALDDLTGVVQKGGDSNSADWRVRSFTYDSLSRLLSATNPESGMIGYSYDLDGNLISRIAPAPNQPQGSTATVTTTYTYDVLNRLTGKSYSDGTSAVQYGYDGAALRCADGFNPAVPEKPSTGASVIGFLNAVCNGVSSRMTSYDSMGRVYFDDRSIGSLGWMDTQYAFLVGGEQLAINYPYYDSQHPKPDFELWWYYNGADNMDEIGTQYHYYLEGGHFTPDGQLTTGLVGRSGSLYAGTTISNSYNNRLQPVTLSETSASGATLYSKTYDFHLGNGDNGSVYQITNNKDNNRTQNFAYDALNRIQQAYTTGPNWGEVYTIDPWGNLTNRAPVSGKTMYEPLNAAPATAQNQLPGYVYDAAGNIINDGINTYSYDAENHVIQESGPGGTWSYFYDGEGNRVEKCSGTSCTGTGTVYWRSALNGATMEETDLSATITAAYVLLDGRPIGRLENPSDTAYYYFDDQVDSTSVITDQTGNIVSESDYYPYGGEIPILSGDTNRYKFTGKERDAESGLDDFGARYYGSSFGRFMTPDWAAKPTAVPYANFGNPQSLNLYSYVENNPTTVRDPDGHCCDPDAMIVTTSTVLGGLVGSLVGGTVGAGGGSLVAPGVGTVGGGYEGAVLGFAGGTLIGADIGNAIVGTLKLSKNAGSGPKAADAPGITAGGQATDKYGNKKGPSGDPQVNQVDHSTEKGAKEAGRQEGKSTPEKHASPKKGSPHFHPTDQKGKKIPGSTHHNYPG